MAQRRNRRSSNSDTPSMLWGLVSTNGQLVTRDGNGNQFTSREQARRASRSRPSYRAVRIALSRA